MKILVVTDAPWVVNDVQATIVDQETTLVQVDDPNLVITSIAEEQPEVVVVDMQVKTMGSMAITRQISDATSAGKIARVPVVMLLDREADRFLAKRAGVQASLRKPFTAQDLRQAIDQAMADPHRTNRPPESSPVGAFAPFRGPEPRNARAANPGFEARASRVSSPENEAD